jgi:antitoxin (DNA-binding transcriptional repressor) of toxin-antitoxin stability system
MTTVTIHQAKTLLSQLIRRACEGEEIVIARGKNPVARLEPIDKGQHRGFGAMKGRARVDARFFEPLSDEDLAAWER